MAGPCSTPSGDRRWHEELNEIVCEKHFRCDMAVLDKNDRPVVHEYVTYRVWLNRRGRLDTGKTP